MLVAAAALAVPLLLVAAKTHGLHLRHEREAAGHREVVFGGTNAPFVEALWSRDRRRFWALVIPLALALALALWRTAPAWSLVLALPWAMSVGFVAMGALSARRLGALPREALAWWAATGALVLATLAALLA